MRRSMKRKVAVNDKDEERGKKIKSMFFCVLSICPIFQASEG
jgi:hypothetical protein